MECGRHILTRGFIHIVEPLISNDVFGIVADLHSIGRAFAPSVCGIVAFAKQFLHGGFSLPLTVVIITDLFRFVNYFF